MLNQTTGLGDTPNKLSFKYPYKFAYVGRVLTTRLNLLNHGINKGKSSFIT